MPYTGSPATNPVDALRILVGDAFEDFEILDDATYQYFLDKNDGDVNKAAIDAAKLIRFQIAKAPYRERAGQYEVWDKFADLYTAALNDLIDGDNGLASFVPIPWAGGISKSDMLANRMNPDRVALCLPRLTTCPYRHWVWSSDFYNDWNGTGDI